MTRKVPAELRAAVFARDGQCVLAKLDERHICRDLWGQIHLSTRLDLCTLEHVKRELRMGVRAEHSLGTMVAMCAWSNVNVPSKEQRAALRRYLADINEGVEA